MGKKQAKRRQKDVSRVVVAHKYPSFIEWAGDLLLNISNSKSILLFSLMLLVVSVVVYYPTMGDDYDIWFHLRYGEHYVKNLTWHVDHSQFSWTPSLAGWKYVTWLGSSILYIAYCIASAPGLYILQWCIFLGIVALYLYYLKSVGEAFDINNVIGLFLLAIAVNLTAGYIKPELFSTLFFAAALFIYFHGKTSSKNLFILYPVIFLIWVNAHGGFIIGLFFVSAAFCMEMLNFFFLKDAAMPKKILKYFGIGVALSYLAILANPYGITYHIELVKSLLSKEYMGEARQLYAYYSMWDYLFPKQYMFRFLSTAWVLVLMGVLFVLVNFYVYSKRRHFDLAILVLNALFFYIGMNTARASMFFPLIWLFSMVHIITTGDVAHIKRKFAPLALLTTVFLTVGIVYHALTYYEHRSWFGVNIDEWLPVKEVEFIKKNKLPGPVFNDYFIGGYMLWSMYPDYKVFIDPRYGPYVRQVWPDWLDIRNNLNPEGLKKFTSKYPFKIALIHMREPNIIFWFLSSPDWRLLYFDKAAVVIIHKSVIPSLGAGALGTDASTNRFKDLTNPLILSRLFDFYIHIGPNYGREIVNIYEQNVSELYYMKRQQIQKMEQAIYEKESQLRQIQLQQQTRPEGK